MSKYHTGQGYDAKTARQLDELLAVAIDAYSVWEYAGWPRSGAEYNAFFETQAAYDAARALANDAAVKAARSFSELPDEARDAYIETWHIEWEDVL